jgi:mono/diheme cytochrome c family protein
MIGILRSVCLACILSTSSAAADSPQIDPADRQFFEAKIRPLLIDRCSACHSAKKARGGLALDTREGLLRGGETGPAIIPGDADKSLLIASVRHSNPELKMPQKGPKLSDEEIADLVRWVNRGAPDPRDKAAAVDARSTDWWSLKPLVRPAVPTIEAPDAGWIRNPIDAFVLTRLHEKKLIVSKEAEAEVLIRRMSFDLHGMPPTPEEVDAFRKDFTAAPKKQDAVERLADRLLASPRYGERWARHWLDVVHFGESNGFGMDRPRFNAWPYRDYVIRSLNADKSYGRFVQEQIAGDVLFPDDGASIPALGFAAAGPFNQSALAEQVDGTDCRKIALNLDRDDMVASVGATFLSMTVQCARCHEHKFDPIGQRDYYRMQAVFAGIGRAERPFDVDPKVAAERKELVRRKRLLEENSAANPFGPEERIALVAAQMKWEQTVLTGERRWQVLRGLEAHSDAGTEFTPLPDGSYLCVGPRPERDTYRFTAALPAKGVCAVRIEVLSDPSLPHAGPGRQDNGNLHLSEFKVKVASLPDPDRIVDVPLRDPVADFNQDGWDISRAIDGKPETAWGIYPQVGKPHQATFEFKSPLAGEDDSILHFHLEQLHGGGHLIGRVRLSVSTQPKPPKAIAAPAAVLADLKVAADRRTPEQAERIARHFRRVRIEEQIAALPKPDMVWGIASDFPKFRNYQAPKEPLPVFLLKRGDVKQPLEKVGPGALACVAGLNPDFAADSKQEGMRRAELAKWLTDPGNMLTWRSIANRVWHYHFDRGIVDSPNDLGRMGSLPTHPELLDWLAVELRDNGGSLKKLHRLIVTSAVYRQVSDNDPARAAVDAENRYLWRMSRPRLDAETLRDSLLAVTGKIDLTMGGPSAMQFKFSDPNKEVSPRLDYESFDPDSAASCRRSVYRFLFRNLNDPLLDTFDAVDPSLSVGKRNATTTPLQALALMNNRFVLRQCEHLAARVEKEASDLPGRVDRACRLVLGRAPRDGEAALLVDYAGRYGLPNMCRVLVNSNDFLFVP